MANQKKFQFELTKDQKTTIREETGEKVQSLELMVENVDGVITPSGFRMF